MSLSNIFSGPRPFYVYKRITLLNHYDTLFHPLDYGCWYFLRAIRARYPELNEAGDTYGPRLKLSIIEKTANIDSQNEPIDINLHLTPGGVGVTVDSNGDMTATPIKNEVKINKVFPISDMMQIVIYGYDMTTALPVNVDVCLVGYAIPDNELIGGA